MTACEHLSIFWYLATNEDGWKCVDCDLKPGEPPGYSPAHDSSHLDVKVSSILQELHDHGFIYVSNATEAAIIAASVTHKVRESGDWDQYTIVGAILAELTPSHAGFWRLQSDAILEGKDKRNRCPCGALSTSTRVAGKGEPNVYRCSEHATIFENDETDAQLLARIAKERAP